MEQTELSMLIQATASYIREKMLQTEHKFEILYSSARDNMKRDQIVRTLKGIKQDLNRLESGNFNSTDLFRYNITEEDLKNHRPDEIARQESQTDKILRNIPIVNLNKFCNNNEINRIWSYLKFFESEYLSLLSEQNLKLDYGHSYQRDKFYTSFHETLRTITRYGELLEQIEEASIRGNKVYKERLIAIQSKHYRDLILKVGKFIHSIRSFIEDIKEGEASDERVLMEPDKIISIEGGNSNIDGITSEAALNDLHEFITEFISFLKIPEIKRIEEED